MTKPSRAAAGLIERVGRMALPLEGPADLDPLLERIGDAHYVLLGEASHGTSEYYRWRARISQRLICEKGFSFIAVEGDWPDCYRVNRYVKGQPDSGADAREVLEAFDRWPTWMWANEEVVELAEWLQRHNDGLAEEGKVGFFGLDVYSLWESLYAVLGYLRKADPSAPPAARRAFRCFQLFGEDVQAYARATAMVPTSCEDEVIELLEELRGREPRYRRDGREDYFAAEQNALIVKGAEAYYRAMVRGGPESWNIRDRHMTETLERLMRHHGPGAKAIVWEHNTHIGDARATDMADDGKVNVSQLVREQHASEGVVLVGFGSYRGSVIAGDEWEAPMEAMRVPPGREGSWEDFLHRAGERDKLLLLDGVRDDEEFLEERGHRAIGVVYHPDRERYGNYVRPCSPAAMTPSATSTRPAPCARSTSGRTWRSCPRRILRGCERRSGEGACRAESGRASRSTSPRSDDQTGGPHGQQRQARRLGDRRRDRRIDGDPVRELPECGPADAVARDDPPIAGRGIHPVDLGVAEVPRSVT
jgi:erythromycin esterase-like protein